MNCKLHPQTPAIATCEGCGTPICHTCRAKRRAEPLCYSCSFDRDDAEGTTSPNPAGLADELLPLPDGPGAKGWMGGGLRYGLAFLLTGGAATLLGLAWWKFSSGMGHDSWWYSIFAGGAIGLVARLAYGPRFGRGLPPIAAVTAAYAVYLHYLLSVSDEILADRGGARYLSRLALAERVEPLMRITNSSLTPLGWCLIVLAAIIAALVSYLSRPLGLQSGDNRTRKPSDATLPNSSDPQSGATA